MASSSSLLAAAVAKYEDEDEADQDQDEDASAGFVICAQKRRPLNATRQICLDSSCIATLGGPAAALSDRLAAMTSLDISGNDLTWEEASPLIRGRVACLASVDLSRNPLGSDKTGVMSSSLSSSLLTAVQLNHTDTDWATAAWVISQCPCLSNLGLAGNSLPDVPVEWAVGYGDDGSSSSSSSTAVGGRRLESIGLGGNEIASWERVASTLGTWSNLHSLFLMGNPIVKVRMPHPAGTDKEDDEGKASTTPTPTATAAEPAAGASPPLLFAALRTLSLSNCPLDGWASVEALACLPRLRDLRLQDVPFLERRYNVDERRMLVIARLRVLSAGGRGKQTVGSETCGLLNRSPITANERHDAERFFEGFVERKMEEEEEEGKHKEEEHQREEDCEGGGADDKAHMTGASFLARGLGRCE